MTPAVRSRAWKDFRTGGLTSGARCSRSAARLVAFLLLSSILATSAQAKTLVVGVEYRSIGEALKRAVEGDTVEVRTGRYNERLRIEKTVRLTGVGEPVLAVESGNIIEVTAPGVLIEGFTLTYDSRELGREDKALFIKKGADGVVVRNNRFIDVMFGIWSFENTGTRIENNTITGLKELEQEFRGNCINLTGVQRAVILDNRLSYCRDGIYMELCHDARVTGNEISRSRYSVHTMWVDRGRFNGNTTHDSLVGMAIMYTDYSEIKGNISYGNKTHGILFIQSVRSEIKDNTVIGNTKGLFLYNSVYNNINSNLVMNNQVGIHSWGGSEDNRISGNTFINNEIQVKFVASRSQQWDDNYWSDYIGWDMTNDGIGDYPYESNTVVDHILWRYPLAKVLYASPSLQLLWVLEKQFPFLKVPRVIDRKPRMTPIHKNWKELMARYPYRFERFYGEIEKLPHMPGGGF